MTSKKSDLYGVEAPEQVTEEMLDADEAEFTRLRRDLPGVKGASAAGIVSISVGKIPGKNEFFRTHAEFRPTVPMVDVEVGMEKQYFAVDTEMTVALASIGINVTDHTLYLTVTPRGGVRIIPINSSTDNDYARTLACSTASIVGFGSTPIRRTRTTRYLRRRPTVLPNRSGRRSVTPSSSGWRSATRAGW
jgi:hypothetical protein